DGAGTEGDDLHQTPGQKRRPARSGVTRSGHLESSRCGERCPSGPPTHRSERIIQIGACTLLSKQASFVQVDSKLRFVDIENKEAGLPPKRKWEISQLFIDSLHRPGKSALFLVCSTPDFVQRCQFFNMRH
ncbi:hypothetical protein LCGC14_2670870, partial [marine sediment metagenome]